jgi:hypothetical protein
MAGQEAQKYGDPLTPHFQHEDAEMALRIDSFAFAIRVTREDGLLVARPETPGNGKQVPNEQVRDK